MTARRSRPAVTPPDDLLSLPPTAPGAATVTVTGPGPGAGVYVTFGTTGATGPGPAGTAIVVTDDLTPDHDPDTGADFDPDAFPTEPGDYVTVKVAAALTGRHPEMLRQWIRRGILPARRGKRGPRGFLLVRWSDLERLADRPRKVGSGIPYDSPKREAALRRRLPAMSKGDDR